ncbi:T9SS type A sorting domain-containing protein [candidate division WOR-3 bacterium]|nr:T9SS type A sorting domain-containing protein [candidate division WOR-3 bacterium]
MFKIRLLAMCILFVVTLVAGTVKGDFRVNADTGTAAQRAPAMAMNGLGNFVIVWMDEREDTGDIYCQMYDSLGNPQGINFKVNDDTGSASQGSPSVAMNDSGFVVSWTDSRNDTTNIYAQRYDNLGTSLDSNFRVNDTSSSLWYSSPSIGIHKNGRFVITWSSETISGNGIKGQMYNKSGIPEGANFIIGSCGMDISHSSVSWGSYPNFVVIWRSIWYWSSTTYGMDIEGERFDSLGTQIGRIGVASEFQEESFACPLVATDNSGEFIVVWHALRGEFARSFSDSGTPQCAAFLVDSGISSACVAMDDSGKFIVVWNDKRYGKSNVFAQKYYNDSLPYGEAVRINNEDTCSHICGRQSVVINDSVCGFVWMDNRNGNWDIYARLMNWRLFGVEEKSKVKTQISKLRVYPNPSYGRFYVNFMIPNSGEVSLKLYDVSGRLVKEIMNGYKEKGIHSINYEGSVKSGVYFLKTDTNKVHKLIIVK